MRSWPDLHWCRMRAVLHCRAISSAAAAEAWGLNQRAFLQLVAPRQISATAAKPETIGRPDFSFATLSVDLLIAAEKKARSFSARQKASEQTEPSRGRKARLR